MYSDRMAEEEDVTTRRLIANFITASTPVEKYLQQGGRLTDLELQSISLTIDGLQTFLNIWHAKHDKKVKHAGNR